MAAVLAAGTALPCSGAEAPLVFVSIPPLAAIVEGVAGSRVRVASLLPPGASPATYEPTPRQMAGLAEAVLFFRIGAPFEDAVFNKTANLMPDLEVVDCRKGIELVPEEEHGHAGRGQAPPDPHIWLDPVRAETVTATVGEALKKLLPGAAGELDRNTAVFQKELEQTNARIAAILAPFAGRQVLVFHPAFGYLTRRYGLQQLAVEVEGKTPSPRQLAALADALEESHNRVLFAQPQFSQSAARAVADSLGCEVVELDPLSKNYPADLEIIAQRIADALGGSGDT